MKNSDKRKVVALSAVRNELHNLKTVIPAWNCFCDKIILCDQMSDDGSREWLSEHYPEVIVIDNPGSDYDERLRAQILIDDCRQRYGTDNVLVYLDADETLCAGVFDSLQWQAFCASEQGTAGAFSWITFWGSPSNYIVDGAFGAVSFNRCAFIDDGRPIGGASEMHGVRGPGGDAKSCYYFSRIYLLHYGFVPAQKNLFKQSWYKVWWRSRGGACFHTNRNHNYYLQVKSRNISKSDESWFAGYRHRGIDAEGLHFPNLPWHAIDVLRRCNEHGLQQFRGLDIWWDLDWEALRKRAIQDGYAGIPQETIINPSLWRRIPCELSRGPGAMRRLFRMASRAVLRKLIP